MRDLGGRKGAARFRKGYVHETYADEKQVQGQVMWKRVQSRVIGYCSGGSEGGEEGPVKTGNSNRRRRQT